MTPLEMRAQLKTLLGPLNVPVKFRGETLPTSGQHIVIDLVTSTPLETLDVQEAGEMVLLQVTAWGKLTSEAAALMGQAHPLLEGADYYRRSTRYPLEDGWAGVSSDYDILI